MSQEATSLADTWSKMLPDVRAAVGAQNFEMFLPLLELVSIEGGVVKLSLSTRFQKQWAEQRYTAKVLGALRGHDVSITRVEFTVRSAARPRKEEPVAAPSFARPLIRPAEEELAKAAGTARSKTAHEQLGGAPLDPRFTFASFAVGRSNGVAHAAMMRIATARPDEPTYCNPLCIVGDTGYGKTHLMQAAAWAANSAAVSPRPTLYLSVERLMALFISASRAAGRPLFGEAFSGIETFMIDDLQFLQGASMRTQFGLLVGALLDSGRQVVIAMDRPPGDLEGFDARVSSRLTGGLAVLLEHHDAELRREIIRHKVALLSEAHRGFALDDAIADFFATNIAGTGRDIDAALSRAMVHMSFKGALLVEHAQRIAQELERPAEPRRIKIEDIQRAVAQEFQLSRADLLSSRRTANVVRPRQIAMYLAKTLTLRSLPEIGRRFGGRDHTTVLHAVRKIEALARTDEGLAADVKRLELRLQAA